MKKLFVILSITVLLISNCEKKEDEPKVEIDPKDTITNDTEDIKLPEFNLIPQNMNVPAQVEWLMGDLVGIQLELYNNSIVKSSDNGVVWSKVMGAGENPIMAKSRDKLYVFNNTGLQSSGNGTTWNKVNSNFDFDTYKLLKFKANDKFLLVSSSNLGRSEYYLHVSIDQGMTFKLIQTGNKLFQHIGLTKSKIWFVKNDSIMSSMDEGQTFGKANIPVSSVYRFNIFDKVVSIDGDQNYMSFDEGENWINNSERIFPFGTLYDGQILAVGSGFDNLTTMYRSPDNGITWFEFGMGGNIYNRTISSGSQTWLTGTDQLVYYENGYPNWRLIGFPNGEVVDAEFTERGMYVAIDKFVLYSHDGGKMWDLRQHLGNWPGASCLSIHPDGRVLVVYGKGEKLNIYDYQLLNLEITKGISPGITDVPEILWLEGKALGLFNDDQEIKYPFLGDENLVSWKLQTRFPLQAGRFVDGEAAPLSLFTLIDGKYNNIAQIAYTTLPNSSSNFWNSKSYSCKLKGEAKSITRHKIKDIVLVQYWDNNLYIANNEAFSRKWTEFGVNEDAKKIRFDLDNNLWVFTNKGTYKSDKPLVF